MKYKVFYKWEIEIEADNKEEAIEQGLEIWYDQPDEVYLNAKEIKQR